MLARWAVTVALCFALMAGAVAAASEWLLRAKVAPNDAAQLHYRFFAAADSRHAAFGDSQMAFGLSGAPGFANLAHLGEPYAVILHKVKRYYRDRVPGRVILQANPSLFSASYEADDAEAMIARYSGAQRLLLLAPEYRGDLTTYWRIYLTGRRFRPNVEVLPDGSRARDRQWAAKPPRVRRALAAEGAAQRQPMPPEQIARSANFAAFRESIRFLQDRGAKICLVDVPVSPELAAAIAARPAYAEARNLIAAVAREFAVPYVDLDDAFADASLFDDENHLNPKGAARFTEIALKRCFSGP